MGKHVFLVRFMDIQLGTGGKDPGYAPINVKPLGGRLGLGGGFDVTILPVVGAFDHSLCSFD